MIKIYCRWNNEKLPNNNEKYIELIETDKNGMLLRSDIQGIMKLIAGEFRICIELYNGKSGLYNRTYQ